MSYTPEDKHKIIQYSYKYTIDQTLESINELNPNLKLSRRTLIRWRKQWKESEERNYGTGNLYDLKDKSKKPKNYRQSKTNGLILEYIQKIRLQYPNLGKDKLKIILDKYIEEYNLKQNSKQNSQLNHIKTISISSIGRIISKLKKQRLIPIYKYSKQVYLDGRTGTIKQRVIKASKNNKKNNKARRKEYNPEKPGDLIQLDAITFYIGGRKRYMICAVDLVSRHSFAYSYKTLSSSSTTDFFKRMEKVFPYPIKHVQTDNGQENHKNFQELLKQKEIIQFWNYPASPKMNAYVERFNRSIQEEFANYNLLILRDNLELFNNKLKGYLHFYNHQRPHLGLKKDYGQFITPVEYLKQYH